MYFDDSLGDFLCVSVLSSIVNYLYMIAKKSLVNIEFTPCDFWCCMFLMYYVNTFENSMSISSVWIVLGILIGLGSEPTFEVVRHLLSVQGRTKLFYLIHGKSLMIRIRNCNTKCLKLEM